MLVLAAKGSVGPVQSRNSELPAILRLQMRANHRGWASAVEMEPFGSCQAHPQWVGSLPLRNQPANSERTEVVEAMATAS